MDGWDWLWMTFMMRFWLVLIGGVVYVAVRLARTREVTTRPALRDDALSSCSQTPGSRGVPWTPPVIGEKLAGTGTRVGRWAAGVLGRASHGGSGFLC
jgi:hypothetical protein